MNKDLLSKKLVEEFPLKPSNAHRPTNEIEVDHLEKRQVLEFLAGRDWLSIKLADLKENYIGDESAILHFLPNGAYKYYLPAFLSICLNEYRESGLIPDALISSILSRGTSGLSESQKEVVKNVLVFLSESYPSDFGDELEKAICLLEG